MTIFIRKDGAVIHRHLLLPIDQHFIRLTEDTLIRDSLHVDEFGVSTGEVGVGCVHRDYMRITPFGLSGPPVFQEVSAAEITVFAPETDIEDPEDLEEDLSDE